MGRRPGRPPLHARSTTPTSSRPGTAPSGRPTSPPTSPTPSTTSTAYQLVVVPQLYALTDAAIDNLLAYVRGGGTLVSGFLTGVADEDDRVRPGGMDARLRELFGIRTLHEWWPLDAGEHVECDGFRGTLWSEEIEKTEDADDGGLATRAANSTGCPPCCARAAPGTSRRSPSRSALRDLLARIAADAGARPVLDGLPDRGRGRPPR